MNRSKLIRLFILQSVQTANDAGQTLNGNLIFRCVQNAAIKAQMHPSPGITEVEPLVDDLENEKRHLVSAPVEEEKEFSITPLGRTWVLQNGARG